LVDRFRVVIFPVITGRTGRARIYDGYPDLALTLNESRTFDRGIQLLDYSPSLLDAPLAPGPGSAPPAKTEVERARTATYTWDVIRNLQRLRLFQRPGD